MTLSLDGDDLAVSFGRRPSCRPSRTRLSWPGSAGVTVVLAEPAGDGSWMESDEVAHLQVGNPLLVDETPDVAFGRTEVAGQLADGDQPIRQGFEPLKGSHGHPLSLLGRWILVVALQLHTPLRDPPTHRLRTGNLDFSLTRSSTAASCWWSTGATGRQATRLRAGTWPKQTTGLCRWVAVFERQGNGACRR